MIDHVQILYLHIHTTSGKNINLHNQLRTNLESLVVLHGPKMKIFLFYLTPLNNMTNQMQKYF